MKLPTSPLFNYRLSQRELQVLRLIAEGQSNVEIAAALCLSPNTVKFHVRSILNKFGVEHRVQAAILAHRVGLIGVEEA